MAYPRTLGVLTIITRILGATDLQTFLPMVLIKNQEGKVSMQIFTIEIENCHGHLDYSLDGFCIWFPKINGR